MSNIVNQKKVLMDLEEEEVEKFIRRKNSMKIGVIGLGYVGFLSLCFQKI